MSHNNIPIMYKKKSLGNLIHQGDTQKYLCEHGTSLNGNLLIKLGNINHSNPTNFRRFFTFTFIHSSSDLCCVCLRCSCSIIINFQRVEIDRYDFQLRCLFLSTIYNKSSHQFRTIHEPFNCYAIVQIRVSIKLKSGQI